MKKLKGFSLVEILLAITVFAIFSVGLLSLALDTSNRDAGTNLKIQALAYAQEGIEATRNIRDRAYLLLTNGDHGLSFNAGVWSFGPAPETVDSFFERSVTIEDVYRDGSDNIVTEGGTLDPDTKKVTSEVAWVVNGVLPQSVSLVSYLSNWRGNDWLQSTCADFDSGAYDGTEVSQQDAPPADDCALMVESLEVASEFLTSVNLGKHADDVDVSGNYAYLAVNEANAGVAVVDVSDKNNLVITDTMNVQAKGRYVTYDNGELYVGVEKNSKALTILNVTNPNNISLLSATALNGNGNGSAVSGNNLFMAVDSGVKSLVSYNIADPASPLFQDDINLGDEAYVVTLNGNYAYVGSDDDHEGFMVFNISNPQNIQEVSSLDLGEEVNSIVLNGVVAYVGTEESDESLYVVNISDPADPQVIMSLDVGAEIQDMTIAGDYLYAALDDNQDGMAAINISNPLSPTLAYNRDIGGKGTGADSDGNYVYITTDTSNKGMVIIETTQVAMATSGAYISAVFDTGSASTQYNFIEWDETEVPGGTVKIQLRTADSAANIENAIWTGADGTNNTYYNDPRTAIVLSPGVSGVRYVQYRVVIESDGVTSPLLHEVRINYSP